VRGRRAHIKNITPIKIKGPIKKKNLLNLKEETFSFSINLTPSKRG